MAIGQQAQQPVGAASQVFVDIRVPRSGQRQVAMVCQTSAKHSNLARSGDVDEIGMEAVQHLSNEGNMARKGWIEAKVSFESEGEDASGQFEGPDITLFGEGLSTIARADAKEGQVSATGEGFKVPAGVRDPVDFVEGVGEVRYSG
jgi:hypothetical protein